ncbi:MAG: pyridoxine 5'-phosphate synthase [bacterium]
MIDLGVNVDHVATVREARQISVPDPVEAASIAERNGADGITVHLRMDRRHIQDRDCRLLRETVKTKLNLEMAISDEMIEKAIEINPDQATLVPESREEITTEGGLDVIGHSERVSEVTQKLSDQGMVVSHFVDPNEEQLDACVETGASAVELHTGDYAETEPRSESRQEALTRLEDASAYASSIGLDVYAGHGLNYRNVQPVASIPEVEELNIGHALVARSVLEGMAQATSTMKELMIQAE